ncbi:MAG: phage terminase large subunit family protein [Methylovirgula sp.]|nr:phage terminase large subunit family protein [Methylovirgula sp.]
MKPRGAGSTAGKWRTADVEIARGPMLAGTEPGVRTISAMVATQLLKTSLIENVFGFHADLDPCPMMIVQPKDDAAEQFSKERIAPFISATPALRLIVGSAKTRSGDDTINYKAFPGGFLALTGAGSPDNLARRPLRIIMYDEVDKYVVTREGLATDIGDERLASFSGNALSIRVCSPTVKGESAIEASYDESDQRRASVTCKDCGHRQFLEFRHVEWDRGEDGKSHRPETAAIHCEACGSVWSEAQRLRSLATIRWHQTRRLECCGEWQSPLDVYDAAWRASDPDPVGKAWDWWQSDRWAVYRAKCQHCGAWSVSNEHAGFNASKLFSPWERDSPALIARKWINAQGFEDRLQVWWNTQMALPYRKNTGKDVSVDALTERCEIWEAPVPDGVALITLGIDVQDYRVEIEVVGWGWNEESWSIDYEVIDGEFSHPATQAALDQYLQRIWHRADGRPFAMRAACIDTGGHHTDAVYEYAKQRLGRKVWGIKGESARTGFTNPVWPIKRPSSRSKKTYRPVVIGVNAAKDFIRFSLAKAEPGPGYMHFSTMTDRARFDQLLAEDMVYEGHGSQRRRKWVAKKGRANEALDCRVYAYAALHGLMHMGLKLNKLADEIYGARGTEAAPPATPAAPPMATVAAEPPNLTSLPKDGAKRKPGFTRRLAR